MGGKARGDVAHYRDHDGNLLLCNIKDSACPPQEAPGPQRRRNGKRGQYHRPGIRVPSGGALGLGGCAPREPPEVGKKTQPSLTQSQGHGPAEGQRQSRPPSQPRVGQRCSLRAREGAELTLSCEAGLCGCPSSLVKRLLRASFTNVPKLRCPNAHRAWGQPPGTIHILTAGPEKS